MSMVTIALVLAVAAADTGSTVAAPPAVALRRYHEIERDMTEALRSEARAELRMRGRMRSARCATSTGNSLPTRDWRRVTS